MNIATLFRRASLPLAASFALILAGVACTAGQQLGEPPGDGGARGKDGAASSSGDPAKSDNPGKSSGSDPNEDAAPAQLPPGAKRFFVSAGVHDGNLGGLAGADQRCTLAAQGANLGGDWKALLDGASLADVGPWYMLNGTKVFNNKANVIAGSPLAAPEITEQNRSIAFGDMVWTGQTIQQSDLSNDDCSGWTVNTPFAQNAPGGTIGDPHSGAEWQVAQDKFEACSDTAHLYCIEQ
jgi:hypothetical protein